MPKNKYGWNTPDISGWIQESDVYWILQAGCFSADVCFYEGCWVVEVSGPGWSDECKVGSRKTLQSARWLAEEEISKRLLLFCSERLELVKRLGYGWGPKYGLYRKQRS